LVTRSFLPDLGGAARRQVALVRRYPEPMAVATVAARNSARYDAAEDYIIERQPFAADRAASVGNRMRWTRWLMKRCRGRVQILHCGDISVAGRLARRVHKRLGIPYVVYVSAGEVRRAQSLSMRGVLGRRVVRLVLGDAAGLIATTDAAAAAARELMQEVGISQPSRVAALGLGTDPALFAPGRDSGTLRQRWGIRRAPIMLTVARLAPHKGQDTGIQALARLRDEFPDLRYVLVGEGSDEARLRNLAADLNVMDRVGFAGPMRVDELPEAYATATIYLDAARVNEDTASEGPGISVVEAEAAALPVVAGDTGGIRSVLSDGESGIVVDPMDPGAVADAIASLLRDAEMRSRMGRAGREAVETYMNWNRVANDTARFVRKCVANG
jgi:glycosyltransferase involved in cell wall biosynthesis